MELSLVILCQSVKLNVRQFVFAIKSPNLISAKLYHSYNAHPMHARAKAYIISGK